MDPGESATQAAIREVAEEAGVTISVTGLSGVYTDPGHVVVYQSGEVRQQFSLCLHAVATAGEPHPDGNETTAAAWYHVDTLATLPIHRGMLPCVNHAIAHPDWVRLI